MKDVLAHLGEVVAHSEVLVTIFGDVLAPCEKHSGSFGRRFGSYGRRGGLL
jgi:hypothetical protein